MLNVFIRCVKDYKTRPILVEQMNLEVERYLLSFSHIENLLIPRKHMSLHLYSCTLLFLFCFWRCSPNFYERISSGISFVSCQIMNCKQHYRLLIKYSESYLNIPNIALQKMTDIFMITMHEFCS